MVVAEVQLDWREDGPDAWLGNTEALEFALAYVVKLGGGRFVLSVYRRHVRVHQRDYESLELAQEAAATVMRLLTIRETG